MKLLKAVGILTALVVLAKIFVFPDYRHRFRLTIEFDTPDGVKSASAVHEVVRKDVRWILIAHGQYEYRFHGEAIFLDLGRGKHVVALLAHGRPGDGRNGVHSGSMTFLGVRLRNPPPAALGVLGAGSSFCWSSRPADRPRPDVGDISECAGSQHRSCDRSIRW